MEEKFLLVQFKRGKQVKVMESYSLAMCRLWALQNTVGKTVVTYIAQATDGLVIFMVQGQGSNQVPKVTKKFTEALYIQTA